MSRLLPLLLLVACPRREPSPDETGETGTGGDTGDTGEDSDTREGWRATAEAAADAVLAGSAENERFGAQVAIAPGLAPDGGPSLLVLAEGQAAVLGFAAALGGDLATEPAGRWAQGGDVPLGDALTGGADLDGDGTADVVVGERAGDGPWNEGGAAWILAGPLVGEQSFADAVATVSSATEGDEVGCNLSVDVGGGALLVGARGVDAGTLQDAGEAWLFRAPLAGDLGRGEADAILRGEDAGDYAGRAVDLRGDLDGDGLADAVVGAYRHSDAGRWAGAAYVVLDPRGEVSLADADGRMLGAEEGEALGRTVYAGADLDGDGRPDVVVGATGWGDLRGTAYMFDGAALAAGAWFAPGDARATLRGEAPDDSGGIGLSAGDLDGDGWLDLVVGAPGERESPEPDPPAGWVGVAWGPPLGTIEAESLPVRLDGAHDGDALGTSLAADGDLDGDGVNDLAIGAYRVDATDAADAGAIYLFSGLDR